MCRRGWVVCNRLGERIKEKDLIHYQSCLEGPCLVSTGNRFHDVICFHPFHFWLLSFIVSPTIIWPTRTNALILSLLYYLSCPLFHPYPAYFPWPIIIIISSLSLFLLLYHTHLAITQNWLNLPLSLFWGYAHRAEKAEEKHFQCLSRASIGS